jgi:hypothetical protein
MKPTIHLIGEDDSDALIVQKILDKRGFDIRIDFTGGGGVHNLLGQLEELISIAKKRLNERDCIAVLHDADEMQQTDRQSYEKIKLICKREKIKLIIAHDTIEAWLLADSGVCKWLKVRAKNWDTQKEPKNALDSLMKKEKGKKYQGSGRTDLLSHIAGDGDQYSDSMKQALIHLKDAPCTKG